MATANDKEVKDGADPNKPDTSEGGQPLIDAEAKLDQDGNVVAEEPENKDTPSGDGKGGGGDEPPSKPSEKKYKYKSQDEAETAYAEAERKMHEATTRAATAEKELAQYRKPAKPDQPEVDPNEEIMTKAYEDIDALPIKYDAQGKETNESYIERKRKSASILSKATRSIAKLEYENTSKVKEGEKEISTKLYKKATTDGLTTDDELDLVGIEFGRTDSSKSIDDRVSDAVEAVKSRVSRLRDGFVKKQQQAKKDGDDLKVLGGGSRQRPKEGGKEDSKPSTMSDAQADINAKRRVRAEDVLRK